MAVTIHDVAARAGVSPMTVSRVTNGSERVTTTTRQRVEAAIAELGYVPNRIARGLRQKTGTLAVIVPDSANPFFNLIVRGAEDVARRAKYRLILCNTDGDVEREAEYLEDMIGHQVEGVLVAPASDRSRARLQSLVDRGLPFVLIDRSIEGFDCDVVQGDSVEGARQLTKHLLCLGHQRIAMIAGSDAVSTSRDRLTGYREALEEAGLPFDPTLVLHANMEVLSSGYQATLQIIDQGLAPTAIFAVNNLVAVGALRALREREVQVPRDMALVCFDDLPFAADLCPFMTVMAQPAESFGTIAMQLLLERIGGHIPERRRRVALQADLIVRASCGSRRASRV
jgi:LacI family transcriptional regulator